MFDQYKRFIAICSGVLLLLPLAAQADHSVSLEAINISVTTDKRVYYGGDTAVYTVAFTDSNERLIDPDLIRATYDSHFIQLTKVSEGEYKHVTEKLSHKDHQLGVYAEKDGYSFAQESSTVRPVPPHRITNHVTITAIQQGDLLKFRINNDVISNKEIYKVRMITIGAGIESVVSSSWIKVPNHIGIDIKSINGSIGPDETQTLKLMMRGKASMVVWTAFDVHGDQIYAGSDRVIA